MHVGYPLQKIKKYIKLNFETPRQLLKRFKGVQHKEHACMEGYESVMKVQVLKVLFIEICRCQGESIRSSVSFVTTQKYVL
jgi:hypothetical protein